jgi:RimJ/RimL family protein N-acetyltransferase
MDTRFVPVAFPEVREDVRAHLVALPAAVDSFCEDHILASTHYRIVIAGQHAGFAAIHGERLITLFALAAPFRHHAQSLFAHLRRLEQVQAAFVPTCDEFFLAHALDDSQRLAKQAYIFAETGDAPPIHDSWSLRPARADDGNFVQEQSGDFFAPIERVIAEEKLFVTLRGEEPVGFGILEASAVYADVASIGMLTLVPFRRTGVGTATISLLRNECQRRGLRAVAGCWYYNHGSKRTLERAGMTASSRLLKIDY